MTPTEQESKYIETVGNEGRSFYPDHGESSALVTVQTTKDKKQRVLTITDEIGNTALIWLSLEDAQHLADMLREG